MGDESDEMWTELNSSTTETGWTVGEEEPGYFEDMNWEPTPIDAAPGSALLPFVFETDVVDYRKTTSGDIVSMLLNIYDTKEVFVKELQVILAERLLASKDYEVERETRNVEMIKSRFGEANIQSCDVMLKDIIESKRVDRLIHSRAENVFTPLLSTSHPTSPCILISLLHHAFLRLMANGRLYTRGFYHDFSGHPSEKRNSACQHSSTTNSPNMKQNMSKSNEAVS